MSFNKLLSQTCTIKTKTEDFTTAGDGSITETWSNTYTSVKCRLINPNGTLEETDGGYNLKVTPYIFLKSDQTISVGNRIVHDNGNTYLVEYINDQEGFNSTHHKEVILRRHEV
ncbi:MAG: head-tail adaptor protein [Candidatus Thorarchaeota archaeon]